jgi:NADH-quinone oxidoreductase subunit F
MAILADAKALDELRESIRTSPSADRVVVFVCGGTGCRASESETLREPFEEALREAGLSEQVELRYSGCRGLCECGPLVTIMPQQVFYQRVQPEDVAEIVRETLIGGTPVERLLYKDVASEQVVVHDYEVPFNAHQQRIALRDNGLIDPTRIEDYIARGGYAALSKVLTSMTPEQVIEEIEKSGLRGRGGGGFPTGRKWRSCRDAGEAHSEPRYVICNGDEGDPGAFMDRSILEGNPHAVLEGMIVGAYAIGSEDGFIYVRAEYPLAVQHLTIALEEAREYGFLGRNILGSGFSFDIRIARGGGAFVCGESTALMASLEGKAGEPRSKYIHTVEAGLWDKPSNLNNVETWACVAPIINNGADWFASIGTEESKGTKVFSVVGKVENTGLVEVPMGITLREIIFDVCGGIKGGKKFKAVQTGGPSGGCIPASMLDLRVDFEHLAEVGSMMGSGGMIVMDEETCMVDVARYFLAFLTEESCGKCTPCREGLRHMLHILTRITQGQGEPGDIEVLEELSDTLSDAALCGLGTTAANPVLSTLRYFRDEYDAHVNEKRCPAGFCRELITFWIDTDACTGCHACFKACPVQAISGEAKKPHVLDQSACIRCGVCRLTCRFDAVKVE